MGMTVTGITEISGTRMKIEIDYEFAFVLYKGELHHYHVREGEEITETDYHTIMTEVLPKRAKLRCMNLLKSREYTTQQLRRKLMQGGYPEAVAEEALNYVASFHYTDDLRYATDYIASRQHVKSRRWIEQHLYSKGISGDLIAQAWQKLQAQGGTREEYSVVQQLLAKKNYHPESADLKEKRRIYAYLLRNGYSHETIRQAMADYNIVY